MMQQPQPILLDSGTQQNVEQLQPIPIDFYKQQSVQQLQRMQCMHMHTQMHEEQVHSLSPVEQLMAELRNYLQSLEVEPETFSQLDRLSKLSQDIQEISLINLLKQISNLTRKSKEQCDMLTWSSEVSTRVSSAMRILYSAEKDTLQKFASEHENAFDQHLQNLETHTQLVRQIKLEPTLGQEDWLQLYQSHSILREIIYAFHIIGFDTTHMSNCLFFVEKPNSHEEHSLTTQPFFYQITCNVSLLKKFLTFLCVKQEEIQGQPKRFYSKDMGSEKVWRQELKQLTAGNEMTKPRTSSFTQNRKRKRGNKANNPTQRVIRRPVASLFSSFHPRILDLLSQLIALPSEKGKKGWLKSSSLSLDDKKYLEWYKVFMKEHNSHNFFCECQSRMLLSEHSKSVWELVRNSRFYKGRLQEKDGKVCWATDAQHICHILPGWEEAQNDYLLNEREEICFQHQITKAVIQKYQSKNVATTLFQEKKCFWKLLRQKVENAIGHPVPCNEFLKVCQMSRVASLLEVLP